MKRKILLLTIGCVLTVLALAAIQGYFIFNTYKLTEKEVKDEIHKQLLEFEDTPAFDALNNSWMAKTNLFGKEYIGDKVKKKDYIRLISRSTDSLTRALSNLMKNEKFSNQYKAHYTNYITSVVIDAEGTNDTIFKGRMRLFGDVNTGSEEIALSTGKWHSRSAEHEKDDVLDTESKTEYSFEIKTERYYSINNWERLILGRMAGLFVFSVLLLAFVVILFYLSLRNLITQKKISDIKTDFVDNITHEFKTPIATMDIAIKTFERGDITREQLSTAIAIIKRQNTRLQSLFSQIKDASLSSFAIAPEKFAHISVEDIKEIIHDFKTAHPKLSIELNAPQDIVFNMGKSHFYTILINVLDNAIKYGANSIAIAFMTNERDTTISIQDDGPGIPVNERKAVFEKFYRVEKGNIHNTKGLGLGLFYVSQVVKAYAGEIRVEDNAGNGAYFIIILPS
jgi:two-component system phosphate regulon sensor histidine kinase PhoR